MQLSLRHRVLLLTTLVSPILAQAADPAWMGEKNCRVAPLDLPSVIGAVSWKGDCVDGFASGKGVLSWRAGLFDKYSIDATLARGEVSGSAILKTPDFTYTGTLKAGVPHGQGFFEYANDKGWYEGEVVAGRRHGYGIKLDVDRGRYTGEWADDARNGRGEASFSSGGSYTGDWKSDRFDGQGKIVYAGAGHTYEGQFHEGRVAGLAETQISKERYAIKEQATGTHLGRTAVNGYLPPSATWDALTAAQKNTVRAQYPALEADDEPPFPARGLGPLFGAVSQINAKLGSGSGYLGANVLVGKDGQAIRVTTYGQPSAQLVKAVSTLMMIERYKPALCRGEPCEMIYPVRFIFSVEL